MKFFKICALLVSVAFASYMPGESGFVSQTDDHGLFLNPAALPAFGSIGAVGVFEIENGVRTFQIGANTKYYGASFDYRTNDKGYDETRFGLSQGFPLFYGLLDFGHRIEALRSADFNGTEFSYTPGVMVQPFNFITLGYTGHDLLYFGPSAPTRVHEFGVSVSLLNFGVSYDVYNFKHHNLLLSLDLLGYLFGLKVPLYGGDEFRLNVSHALGTNFEIGTRFSKDYIPHRLGLSYHYANYMSKSIMLMARVPLDLPVKDSEEERIPFFGERSYSIYTLRNQVEAILAAKDLKIVIFDFSGYSGGLTVSKEIARNMKRLREDKRYVVAFLDDARASTLVAASNANLKVLEPSARVNFRGFGGTSLFYKGLLNKLGVEVQFLRHGAYKSAVEPYMADSMSKEARSDLERIYSKRFETLLSYFPKEKQAALDSFAKSPMLTASAAYKAGLVDTVLYIEDVPRVAVKKFAHVDAPYAFAHDFYPSNRPILGLNRGYRPEIGLVTIEGTITENSARKILKDLKEVENTRSAGALIVRINSPGGSAQASDKIWHALRDLSRRGLPIVASIGDVGASGGYYIACGADEIIAEDFSLVGSIGIYGGKINAKALLEKIGIKRETVKTHEHADAESFTRGFDETERMALQDFMDDFYKRFLRVVARATWKTNEQVDETLGGGRVFTGSEALENGLVKRLGGLDVAMAEAKFLAGYSQKTIVELVDYSSDKSRILGNPAVPLTKTGPMAEMEYAVKMLSELSETNIWALDFSLIALE